MASHCEVRVAGLPAAAARAACDAAIAEVRRIERTYSRYRDDSIVARINRAAGGAPVALDEETAGLLRYADALVRESGGLFDPTSGVLRRVWDFKAGRPPSTASVAALLPLIGWDKVVLDDAQVRLTRAGMELDFGGFGKEYATDRAAAVLASRGVTSGFVNLGGDLRAIGPRPDGEPWRIGIQDPREPAAMSAWLPLSQGALATSGDYERFFEFEGRRYCHLLDPRSGWPVDHWRSISVLAPVAVAAGSCSTIAMLMGAHAADWLAGQGVAWLGIDAHGDVHGVSPEALDSI